VDSNEHDLKAQLAAMQSTLAECLESGDVAGMGRAKAKIKKLQSQIDAQDSAGSAAPDAVRAAQAEVVAPEAVRPVPMENVISEAVRSAPVETVAPEAKPLVSSTTAAADAQTKTAATNESAQNTDIAFSVVTPAHMGGVSGGGVQNMAVVSTGAVNAGIVTPESLEHKPNPFSNLTSSVAAKLLPSKQTPRPDHVVQDDKDLDVDALFSEDRLAALARSPEDEEDVFDEEAMPLQFSPNFEPDLGSDLQAVQSLDSEEVNLNEELLKIAIEASIELEESGPIVNLDSDIVDSDVSDSSFADTDVVDTDVINTGNSTGVNSVEIHSTEANSKEENADAAALAELVASAETHFAREDVGVRPDDAHLHSIAQLLIESLEHGTPDENDEIKTSYLSTEQLNDLTERFYTISTLSSDEQSLEINAFVQEIIADSAHASETEALALSAEEVQQSVSNLVSEIALAKSAPQTDAKKSKETEAQAKPSAGKVEEAPSVKKELSKFWKFFTKPEQFLAEANEDKAD
jgi:hypothetical protein